MKPQPLVIEKAQRAVSKAQQLVDLQSFNTEAKKQLALKNLARAKTTFDKLMRNFQENS